MSSYRSPHRYQQLIQQKHLQHKPTSRLRPQPPTNTNTKHDEHEVTTIIPQHSLHRAFQYTRKTPSCMQDDVYKGVSAGSATPPSSPSNLPPLKRTTTSSVRVKTHHAGRSKKLRENTCTPAPNAPSSQSQFNTTNSTARHLQRPQTGRQNRFERTRSNTLTPLIECDSTIDTMCDINNTTPHTKENELGSNTDSNNRTKHTKDSTKHTKDSRFSEMMKLNFRNYCHSPSNSTSTARPNTNVTDKPSPSSTRRARFGDRLQDTSNVPLVKKKPSRENLFRFQQAQQTPTPITQNENDMPSKPLSNNSKKNKVSRVRSFATLNIASKNNSPNNTKSNKLLNMNNSTTFVDEISRVDASQRDLAHPTLPSSAAINPKFFDVDDVVSIFNTDDDSLDQEEHTNAESRFTLNRDDSYMSLFPTPDTDGDCSSPDTENTTDTTTTTAALASRASIDSICDVFNRSCSLVFDCSTDEDDEDEYDGDSSDENSEPSSPTRHSRSQTDEKGMPGTPEVSRRRCASVERVAVRWCISVEDAAELMQNVEDRIAEPPSGKGPSSSSSSSLSSQQPLSTPSRGPTSATPLIKSHRDVIKLKKESGYGSCLSLTSDQTDEDEDDFDVITNAFTSAC